MASNLIAAIEQETSQRVTISAERTESNIANCNQQIQSPLFNKIPPEIRNEIFRLTTQPYYQPDNIYSQNGLYHHQDDNLAQTQCTSLLRTCRLVWLETHALPSVHARTATHHFYLIDWPFDEASQKACKRAMEFNQDNIAALWYDLPQRAKLGVEHIHFHSAIKLCACITGCEWAHGLIVGLETPDRGCPTPYPPKVLTITNRHLNWPPGNEHMYMLRMYARYLETAFAQRTSSTQEVRPNLSTGDHGSDVDLHGDASQSNTEADVAQLSNEASGLRKVDLVSYTLAYKWQHGSQQSHTTTAIQALPATSPEELVSGLTEEQVAAANRYRDLWASQGSLLRFAEDG
ncbi:uncharacterized protein LTR77_004975 [Saxophila tyrrhenica]|uniref:Uncharacterized protein n=1 Tax=Saxophila tyrrhenica TaxID=1690608 RepID=A0AAV9PER8_9PEZI|nr:hypothetical protein LTR77_004975 [Saxophila tyrrhenica]